MSDKRSVDYQLGRAMAWIEILSDELSTIDLSDDGRRRVQEARRVLADIEEWSRQR